MRDRNLKENLAIAYKILADLKMDDLTYTHLSIRSSKGDSFYIYPFGMLFSEVEASCLLEVDFTGKVLEGEEYQYNKTGYIIHSIIYKSRPDINAVFHLHTIPGVAVSCMKDGLLPISQFALHFYEQVRYHNYNSLALTESSGKQIIHDLEDKYIMFLKNHGTLTCGKTIHEAMYYTNHLEKACRVQIAAFSAGIENLVFPSKDICKQSNYDLLNFEKDLGMRDWLALKKSIKLNTSNKNKLDLNL